MALTAGTPLPVLVDALERADWGSLGTPELRGLGRVLSALSRALPARSAAGRITAPQLAGRVGYTERWVRRCLALLEDLGVISWERGGIVAGAPVPSFVCVEKHVLVDLVTIARKQQGERLAAAAAATRSRIERLRTSYTRRPGKRPRDRKQPRRVHGDTHAELGTALLSLQEEAPSQGPASGDDDSLTADKTSLRSPHTAQSRLAQMRADLAAIRGPGRGEKRSNETGSGVARGVGRPSRISHVR